MHYGENRKNHRSLKSKVEDQERKDQPARATETSMVAMGERVVMQTALVSIRCNGKF